MTSSAEIDDQICAMRVAVINATLMRLGYAGRPERISQLVKFGWKDSKIYSQIVSEQPVLVRAKVWLIQTFWFLVRMRLIVAALAVIVVTAFLGRAWISEVAVAGWEAIQQDRGEPEVQPAPEQVAQSSR